MKGNGTKTAKGNGTKTAKTKPVNASQAWWVAPRIGNYSTPTVAT